MENINLECIKIILMLISMFSIVIIALSFSNCILHNCSEKLNKILIIFGLLIAIYSTNTLNRIIYSEQYLNQFNQHKKILFAYLKDKKNKYGYCTNNSLTSKNNVLENSKDILELTLLCEDGKFAPDKYWTKEEKIEYENLVTMFDKKYTEILHKLF